MTLGTLCIVLSKIATKVVVYLLVLKISDWFSLRYMVKITVTDGISKSSVLFISSVFASSPFLLKRKKQEICQWMG